MVQEIKSLRSTVQQRDKEKAERATLVQQEKLVRGKVGAGGQAGVPVFLRVGCGCEWMGWGAHAAAL